MTTSKELSGKETGLTPSKLFKKLDELEGQYTLKELQQMAREKGISPTGTKRDILRSLFVRHAETYGKQAPLTKIYKTLAYYKASNNIKRDGIVKIDQDGNLSCNCDVWIYNPVNGVRNCEHIVLAKEDFRDQIQIVKDYGLFAITMLINQPE
jgi:hypothetical protein